MMENTVQSKLYYVFEKYRDKIAVEYGFNVATYDELNQKSNRIADQIKAEGTEKGSFIAILVDDKIELIAAMVGILKAGCVFVPLDPSYPVKRLESMLGATDTGCIFADKPNRERLSGLAGRGGISIISSDEDFDNVESLSGVQWPEVEYGPEDAVYVFFTSGSTGEPKAIVGKNRSLLHFINWEIETFGIDDTFCISQLTSPCHDPLLRDVFVALCSGGTVCIPERRELILESSSLNNWIEFSNISLIHCTPSLFRLINSNSLNNHNFKSLKYVLMAGERINPGELAPWYRTFGERIQLVNMYGSTETTMVKTYYMIKPADTGGKSIPVGKPMKGSRVIVLNEDMNICSPGDIGEVYIRTPYTTLGYYKNPEANREKFVVNPFSNDPGDIIYKTGDLGRLLPDGNLELLGRKDRQVKIRGIRIELSEIENVMSNHEAVKEAVVIDRERPNGDKFLCAYFVENTLKRNGEIREGRLGGQELRAYLSERLPGYMVPQYFTPMDKLPVTPSGKLDYKALPDPDKDTEKNYIAPRDEIEIKLAGIWREILGIEKIGIDENFLQAGGHSLNIMTMISMIYQEFGVELPLGEVFNNATIEGLAKYIKNTGKTACETIQQVEEMEYYPISPAQKRIFVLEQLKAAQTSYNMPAARLIEGKIGKERLERAFETLIRRHEALRTTFEVVDGEPVQWVHKNVEFKVAYKKARENEVGSMIEKFIRPFDHKKAPLLRVELLELSQDRYILLFDMDHIISDATSMGILVKEFTELYNGRVLPELKIQYKDYTAWQNNLLKSERIQAQERYWLDTFAGEIPVLDLPTDYPRPPIMDFKGEAFAFDLSSGLTAKIKELASKNETTIFLTLLAAYNVLLSKLTGQEDIIVGTPVSARRHIDLENIIGILLNTVVLRNYPQTGKIFRSFLEEVKRNSLDAFQNQDYQFEMLLDKLKLRRDLGRNPLFDTLFNSQNMADSNNNYEVDIDGLKFVPYEFDTKTTTFDITVYVNDAGDKISINGTYRTSIFKKSTIQYLMDEYVKLLEEIVLDPDKALKDYKVFDRKSIKEAKVTTGPQWKLHEESGRPEAAKTVVKDFERQAERYRNKLAIKAGEKILTYGDLNKSANRVARSILKECEEQTQSPGDGRSSRTIALLFGHGIEAIVGMLGALKSGEIYVPLDPAHPEERLTYILKDAGTDLIITDNNNLAHAEALKGKMNNGIRIVNIDAIPADISKENPDVDITPEQFAYVLYTSGSTGNPKGVIQNQKNVLNFAHCYISNLGIGPSDNMVLFTSYSHASAVIDIFGALLSGATLYPYDIRSDKSLTRLPVWLREEEITIYHSIPTVFRYFMGSLTNGEGFPEIRLVVLGGEAVLKKDVELYKNHFTENCILVNFLGASEILAAAFHFVDMNTEIAGLQVPAGYTVDGVEAYLLNEGNEEAGVYGIGEIVYKSEFLTPGYWNLPNRTKEVFVKNPVTGEGYVYRSRDLGRLLPDGTIEFVGRKDHQLKIRGYRVEPGEVEAVLNSVEGIEGSVVTEKEREGGENFLAAYYVTKGEEEIDERLLKRILQTRLPEYMVPSRFMLLDKLPLTPNGKVDRRKLPEIEIAARRDEEPNGAQNEMEERLLEIWKRVLKLDVIGTKDDFFELGGNSMVAIKLEVETEREGIPLSSSDVYRYRTIKEQAFYIQNKEDKCFCDASFENVKPLNQYSTGKEEKPCMQKEVQMQGPNGRILNNIEPFNDVFYRGCFFNSLFPVISHFGKSIVPFIVNDIPIYHYDKTRDGTLSIMTYTPVKSLEQIAGDLSLGFKTKIYCTDIVEDLIESISGGRPVILWIDCFYESIRDDMYLKNHWEHTLLLYGYDRSKKMFHVIEHRHRDNLAYEKLTVSCRDISNAYKGYMDNFYQTGSNSPVYFEIFAKAPGDRSIPDNEEELTRYRSIFWDNLLCKRELLLKGVECLASFMDDFAQMISDEKALSKNIVPLVDAVNDVINIKKVEKYKILKLFGCEFESVGFLDATIEQWDGIRAIVVKFMYSSVYKKEAFQGLIHNLEQICQLECKYYESLFSYTIQ